MYNFLCPDFVPTKSMLAKIIPLNFSSSAAEKCTFSPELNNHLPKEKKLLHIYKKPPKVLETKHFGGFAIKEQDMCYQNFKKYINPLSIDCQ